MQDNNDFTEVNKALWNERTKHHVGSDFYDMPSFRAGVNTLKEPELELLGDVKGKTVLHLQCHFGQDSLSLARMGAIVTGVDLSDAAIDVANGIAKELSLGAQFICCNIYDLPQQLSEQFDIVFTSYGTIGWLPGMKAWAAVVARSLKPGGKFVFAEFHPAVWMFDNDFTFVQYAYFNKEVIVEVEEGTYADKGADMKLKSIGWNHGLAEVMQSLIGAGLVIEVFNEYDYSPYNCFNNTIEVAPGRFQIRKMEGKLPLMYTLRAAKP